MKLETTSSSSSSLSGSKCCGINVKKLATLVPAFLLFGYFGYQQLPSEYQFANGISLPVSMPCSMKMDSFMPSPAEVSLFKPDDSLCPISAKVSYEDFDSLKPTLDKIWKDEQFKKESAEKLGGAVRIPTEVFDGDNDISDGSRFDTFGKLHEYLHDTFPLVHEKLSLEKVNKYGLVYTWEGSDKSLKPLVLMAHQDVVPVEWATESRWTYPPFSGHFDGKTVWGRGSNDCKNLLVGLLESAELLLNEEFKPVRTVIFAFGYDEETSGTLGAQHIAIHLEKIYGKDSIYAIIDEGATGVAHVGDRFFTTVATGEKGYLDSVVALTTPGGHSSIPPDHTSIGIMSEFVNEVESTPFDPIVSNANPYLGYLQCFATHSKSIDPEYKKEILLANVNEKANKKLRDRIDSELSTRYFIKTSQATDIFDGGMKANALPEAVSVTVNSRISIDSNVKETSEKILGNLMKVAEKYDLGVYQEGKLLRNVTENGYFNYTFVDPLEVAPVSPWSGEVWDTFSGALRHLYEDVLYSGVIDSDVVVTPGISTGNTDTKSYWNLTKNIYRYKPGDLKNDTKKLGNAHSVDEFVSIDSHLAIIAFYYEYLRVVGQKSVVDV